MRVTLVIGPVTSVKRIKILYGFYVLAQVIDFFSTRGMAPNHNQCKSRLKRIVRFSNV